MSRVLLLSNYFLALTFRKELIKRLCDEGHEVFVSLPDCKENEMFKDLGCKMILTEIDRRGVNPKNDLKLIKQYKKIFKEISPDIIFSYTIKPNIYGSMVANKLGIPQICNITGTGAMFLKNNLVSRIATFLYKRSIKKCYKVFFQNTGDRDFFVKKKMVKDNYAMLPGSGCNLDEHRFAEMQDDGTVRFIFIGRVMKLKGIEEFLSAAKALKEKYPNTEFLIAGYKEESTYDSILEEYENKGYIKYIGFQKNLDDWIAGAHCAVLPSHGGEGIPNALLESGAIGRALIGSDTNGINDVIDNGKNGYLFRAADAEDLIVKMEKFIELPFDEKRAMGAYSRRKVEQNFNRETVIKIYLDELAAVTKQEKKYERV